MTYKLNKVTIRTNNSKEGIKNIGDIWNDITSGKLPIIFDSEHVFQQGISTVSEYSNYSSDENGEISVCTRKAWEKVCSEQKSGDIHRTFIADFENTVPSEYTKDGKVHCYLYVAIQ
ncbi:AraC family transcriptional regulator [Clostridium estertheticum]|uniref:AraC family transcriptional regulator n=1 Tax=Clostridium estertheticum TaxID=238834 RepID=UPI001CF3A4DB|nr:AraC family transcriptional regulator [Clostridium estertheticum]MCB2361688.1 AraC family transcriptional regulator [Clostridium estertheticum]